MEQGTSRTVSVIGLGYIGLPTAAMFASRKVPVIGVDVNQAAVATINEGRILKVPEVPAVAYAVTPAPVRRPDTGPSKTTR